MASVTCKKCGNEVEIPEGHKSNFLTCPNCSGAIMLPRQKPVINRSSYNNSNSGMTSAFASSIGIGEKNNSNIIQVNNSTSLNKNVVACKWCKEPIDRGTQRCPHCGEYQNSALSDRESLRNEATFDSIAIMTWPDKIACRLSPIGGIIVGAISYFIKSPLCGGILKESVTSLILCIVIGLINQVVGGAFSLLILIGIGKLLKDREDGIGELILSMLSFYFILGLILVFLIFKLHITQSGLRLLFISMNVLSFLYLLIKTICFRLFK